MSEVAELIDIGECWSIGGTCSNSGGNGFIYCGRLTNLMMGDTISIGGGSNLLSLRSFACWIFSGIFEFATTGIGLLTT